MFRVHTNIRSLLLLRRLLTRFGACVTRNLSLAYLVMNLPTVGAVRATIPIQVLLHKVSNRSCYHPDGCHKRVAEYHVS